MYVIYVLHVNSICWENEMYINYDYYRVFYYVTKYRNVSQAAKLLLNNQPNLTRTIKSLNQNLAARCFCVQEKA